MVAAFISGFSLLPDSKLVAFGIKSNRLASTQWKRSIVSASRGINSLNKRSAMLSMHSLGQLFKSQEEMLHLEGPDQGHSSNQGKKKIKKIKSPASDWIQIHDLWIMRPVFYHCATTTAQG